VISAVSSHLFKVDPDISLQHEARVTVFFGRQTFSGVNCTRLNTLDDWCDLNRERHGFQSSFQHYVPEMIKDIERLLEKFGFKEIPEDERTEKKIRNDKETPRQTASSDRPVTAGEKDKGKEVNRNSENKAKDKNDENKDDGGSDEEEEANESKNEDKCEAEDVEGQGDDEHYENQNTDEKRGSVCIHYDDSDARNRKKFKLHWDNEEGKLFHQAL
jgi:hypothetical protein